MHEKQSADAAQERQGITVHISPDLEYVYRDIANMFVGAGDVVIEFGNQHRSLPGHVSISNRIVMSIANAYELQQRLQQVLAEAQVKLRETLQKQQ